MLGTIAVMSLTVESASLEMPVLYIKLAKDKFFLLRRIIMK